MTHTQLVYMMISLILLSLSSACDDSTSAPLEPVGPADQRGGDQFMSDDPRATLDPPSMNDRGPNEPAQDMRSVDLDAGIGGQEEVDSCQGMNCDDPMTACAPGESGGCLTETDQRVCDPTGAEFIARACPDGQYCLRGECGIERCESGETRCDPEDPGVVLICNAEGTDWVTSDICEEETMCQNGSCLNRCELAAKLNTYIGCEYWTVDLDNYPDFLTSPMPNEVPHSVVLSNPGDRPATVRFETRSGASIVIDDPIVPAGDVRAFTMPRLDVDGSGISFNSIKVSASMPVTAYQFNPLNNSNVFSNDASLLLPVNTLGRQHIIVSWPTGVDTVNIIPSGIVPQAGYFTVVAVAPGMTEVTVTVTSPTMEGPEVPAMMMGEQRTFQLEQFQVLNLEAAPFTPASLLELFNEEIHDLTGSTVDSSQPVAVFGGHEEAVIAFQRETQGAGLETVCCADHLEEQIFPVHVWTDEVLCTKTKPRSVSGEKDIWRVFSGQDGNRITSTPSIPDLDGLTLNYGEWVQIESELSFKVSGTGPVMAAQYMISQGQTDEVKGDPSMILSVPIGQYRSEYAILVPDGYDEDWVTVIRPTGISVTLDDSPIMEPFSSFADGNWELSYVQLQPGMHAFSASQPFGLIAYGWNQAVSYGYPAGLNLRAADWMP